jgi:prevent-host-death family protein
MTIVNMLDAKTHLLRLVEAVEAGAESEIVITRNGRPAAKLVAVNAARHGQRLGVAQGEFVAPDDIDIDNDLIAAVFEGPADPV